jgi:hypothetical protein
MVFEKMSARRLSNPPSLTPTQKGSNVPSTKNGDDKKRYFKREVPEGRNLKGSASEEKLRVGSEEGGAAEMGVEKTNTEYLKLHDKLSFLEFKIAEMKRNLQRKKEDKVRRRREVEERERVQVQVQNRGGEGRTSKAKSVVNLGALVTQVPERKELHSFDKNPYSPRHSIYYVSEVIRAYTDPKSLAREHLNTSLQVMAYFEKRERPCDEKVEAKRMRLERRKGYEGTYAATQAERPWCLTWMRH